MCLDGQVTPYGSLARLKARLVGKEYSQVYGLNYVGTFSSRENDICADSCIISVDISLTISSVGHRECLPQWYLDDGVYIEQSSGSIAQGESANVCKLKNF